jgi:hypothetical protein
MGLTPLVSATAGDVAVPGIEKRSTEDNGGTGEDRNQFPFPFSSLPPVLGRSKTRTTSVTSQSAARSAMRMRGAWFEGGPYLLKLMCPENSPLPVAELDAKSIVST